MKLNDDTISVLKNFSMINQGIMLRPGKEIKTISDKKNILAVAKIDQEIEGDAGIYDLARFLSTVDVLDEPDISFKDDRFIISKGRSKVEYTYAAENMLVLPPDREVQAGQPFATFTVPWETLQSVIRASGVLSLGDISFRGENGEIKISAVNRENPTADTFEISLDKKTDEDFEVVVRVEHLRLLPLTYEVNVTENLVHFKNDRVEYWIAVEANK